jgi:prepilin-type N-terminal cleavage/methylation domain-containing protein
MLQTLSRHEVNDRRRRRRGLKPDAGSVDLGAVARRLRDCRRAEQGFTLIEVLVSALITLIISAGVATALIASTDFTSRERNQSQANEVAQQDQERMKSMSDSQLTSLHQTRTVTLNNNKFTVISTAAFEDATGGSSCTSKSQAYFKLTSTVTTVPTAGNPAQAVTEETIVTRPLAGSLLVQVNNQTAAPLGGTAIAIAGQSTKYAASATTDANGCVAFAGLPTDTYTINATDPGYVDPNGNTTATEAVGVTQTSIASPPTLIMGPAAAQKVGFITNGTSVTYDSYASAPYPAGHGAAPVAYELSYYGAGGGVNMSTAACLVYPGSKCAGTGSPTVAFTASTPVSTFVAGNLFPFYLGSSAQYTNNYQVWAGSCEQEQPLQPPAGTGFMTVMPGEPASTAGLDGVVYEPAVDLAVQYNGTNVAPAHVSIKFSGKNSAGTTVTCTDTWHWVPQLGTETIGPVLYRTYPAPFASTAPKGSTNPMASNTGDTGTIQVCADYNNKYEWSTPTTNTNFNAPTFLKGASGQQIMDLGKDTGLTSGTCP